MDTQYFNEDYFTNGIAAGKSGYDKNAFILSNDIFQQQATMLVDILKLKNKRVVDLGCARGNLVYYLRQLGVNVYGEDISIWAWRNSHVKLFHRIGNVEDHIHAHNLDVVITFHTFEHLEKPDLALANVFNALREGGIFFAVIPCDGHEDDASGISLLTRDEWHAKLVRHNFKERKDLFDRFFWWELRKAYQWEVYCYERC